MRKILGLLVLLGAASACYATECECPCEETKKVAVLEDITTAPVVVAEVAK